MASSHNVQSLPDSTCINERKKKKNLLSSKEWEFKIEMNELRSFSKYDNDDSILSKGFSRTNNRKGDRALR